jgi:undecaprenyl-diphosphatase
VSTTAPYNPARWRSALLLILTAAWIAFAILTLIVVNNPDGTAFDHRLAPTFFDAANSSEIVAGLGRVLDVVGGNLIAGVIVSVVVVVLLSVKRRLLAGYLAASAIGGLLLSSLVKGLVERPRPPTVGVLLQESTWSYPSGHATSGITVFVALGLVALVALNPRWRWWVAVPLFIIGPLIGVSRIVVGVHWPTDVLGGWALGSAWTATVAVAILGFVLARESLRPVWFVPRRCP